MDDAIKRVFAGSGTDKVYAWPTKGGYGGMELQTQMQGHRAAILVCTLSNAEERYTKYYRLKMLHHMNRILLNSAGAGVVRVQRLGWADFRFERTGRFFQHLEWAFTSNESLYLESWKKVVKSTRDFQLSTTQLSYYVVGIGS